MDTAEGQQWILWQLDAEATLRSLKPGTVQLIITDPAYESLEKHRLRVKSDGQVVHRGRVPRLKKWFPIFGNERFEAFFAAAYEALSENAHMYVMCDHETAFIAAPIAQSVGFKFWKPLVWDKGKIGMGYHYRARYEFVLFFEKGKRKLADLSVPDVLEFPRVRNGYPTQKPTGLTDVLVRQSASPGEVVCDPFCGSGSTGVSAIRHGCKFLGADLEVEALTIAHGRLTEWQNGKEQSEPGVSS